MKLLSKTIRTYLTYSFSALIITIPLFYFVVKNVLLHSVDRSLRTQMRDIRSNLSSISSAGELAIWSKMDKDIRLSPAEKIGRDRFYTVYRKDFSHKDEDPYRELSGNIQVNGQNYELVISNSLVENEDLLGSILIVQSILLVMLMAGMLWINQLRSAKIWQPFQSTLDAMKKYELNNHNPITLVKTDIDEFKDLQKVILALTEKNYAVYQKQKEFTENASHEMQTPLAIFQGKIDLLMQTQPMTEEQASLISSLEQVNLRLAKLNKSLLLLSKIDNNQFQHTESISLDQLIHQLVDQYGQDADLRRISIREQYSNGLSIIANKSLIEILIGNLLSNAIRYNIDGGEVRIHLQGDELDFINSAEGPIVPADRIFERFYKSGDRAGSIGLGLAIAKEICDLYHFDIVYSFEKPFHRFRLRFHV